MLYSAAMQPRSVTMLAFRGVQILDVTGPLQMFAGANDELGQIAYRIEVAAPEAGPVESSSGLRVYADLSFAEIDAERLAQIDTLIAAGGNEQLRATLAAGEVTRIFSLAKGRVRRIASVCSGAFFLAAAGLLDGRRAATHWNSVARLRRFRPQVDVDADAIHVEDGGIWTSAGVTAGIDLALAMIEADHGREVTLAVARRHVVYRIRPGGQSQFSAELAGQSASDERLAKLTESVLAAPSASWNVDRLAARRDCRCGRSAAVSAAN